MKLQRSLKDAKGRHTICVGSQSNKEDGEKRLCVQNFIVQEFTKENDQIRSLSH